MIKRAELSVKVVSQTRTILSPQREKLFSYIEFWRECEWTPSILSQIVEDINSNERFKQYRGIIGARRLLSKEIIPIIQQIIDANLLPRMIKFLQIKEEPLLQLEAALALTHITSGTSAQTQVVLEKGGLSWLIELLRSSNRDLNEQAIWTLGNIAGNSATFRDTILANRAIQPLIKIFEDPGLSKRVIKVGIWLISNLCRGGPPPPIDQMKSTTPILCKIIESETDIDILVDAVQALSYLSGSPIVVEDVVSYPNAVSALVFLLS